MGDGTLLVHSPALHLGDSMKTRTDRKIDSIMADARDMAEYSGIVRPETMGLWFGDYLSESGTMEYARNVRRAAATACLVSDRGFPPHLDAYTMRGIVGL